VAQAEHLIQQAALRDRALDGSDVAYLRTAKADLLDSGQSLEVVPTGGTMDSVGGMDRLKEWLRLRVSALDPKATGSALNRPLSRSRAEQIAELRAWAATRAIQA
jgi:hypothetical protein